MAFHNCTKALLILFSQSLFAATILVTDPTGNYEAGTLGAAFQTAVNGDVIDCSPIAGQTISLESPFPAMGYNFTSPTDSLTILGSGVTIDGGGRPAFALPQGAVTMTNLTIQNCVSRGGSGGPGLTGGGGGTGGGAALYIQAGATMTISAVSMNTNQAVGGHGGNGIITSPTVGSGAGGGGYGGGGGGASTSLTRIGSAGGGGGNAGGIEGGTAGGTGSPNTFTNFGGAGGGGEIPGVTGATTGGTNATTPPTEGGLRGVGTVTNGAGGGGGGGASGNGSPGADAIPAGSGIGGAGGIGFGFGNTYGAGGGGGGGNGGGAGVGASGGGGGFNGPGGAGGSLGGGGGASSPNIASTGGNGGLGAGGGAGRIGGTDNIYGLGGAGGSATSTSAGGGGGSGLGGAVLIQQGGTLIIQDGVNFSGNFTTAGVGGTGTSPGGDGASLGKDIFIQGGGVLNLQINGTLTIPNPIEGVGSFVGNGLVKNGTGVASLNGGNTYPGDTSVQAGTVNLNGSVTGNVFIEAAGALSGNATTGGNIYNRGTISPGNSIGTIDTTNLYQYSTGVYDVEVNSTGMSDEIIASGLAQIAGGVVITPDNLNFLGPLTYTIISTSTGVTGTFSSLTSTVPAVMKLIYNPLTVQLTYLPVSVTGNALNAASCFTTLVGPDVTTVNNVLFALSPNGLQTAFRQMGPEQFADLAQVQLLDAILVRSTYTKHLQKHCAQPLSLWIDLLGQWQNQQKSTNHFGYEDTTIGATLGIDYCINHFTLGAAFSYTQDYFHWKQSAGRATLHSYYGGVYALWNYHKFYLNAAILGAQNNYKPTRHLHFGSIDRQAYSKHTGSEWLANFGLGYQVHLPKFQWTPYINVDYVQLHENSSTESGANSLDLHVHKKNGTLLQSEFGMLFSAKFSDFIPKLTLAYINQTPFSSKNYHANFVNSTCVFAGQGRNYERNLFAPRLELTYKSFSVYYDAEISNKYWAQDVGFDFTFCF